MASRVLLLLCLQSIAALQQPLRARSPRTALAAARTADAFAKQSWSGSCFPEPRIVFAKGPSRAKAPTYRECVAFAAPALAIYVAGPLMSLIDAGFIGRRSSLELAALGPAGTISDSATTLLVFLSVATTDLARSVWKPSARVEAVARARCGDAGDECDLDAAARATTSGLLLALVVGAFAGGAMVGGAAPLCRAFAGAGAEGLAEAAAPYVAIRAAALPAALLASVAQAACLGLRDAKTPGASVAVAAALNLAGDFLLVPKRGLVGAAVATAASQYAAAALLVGALWKKRVVGVKAFPTADGGFARVPTSFRRDLRPFFLLGPFMFCCAAGGVMKLALHNSSAMVAAALDGARAAAHTAVFSVAMFCFVLGDVGTSVALAFLPKYVGDGEGRRPLDTAAAAATTRQILRVSWSISALCVAVSTAVVLRGSLLVSDPAVLRAMVAVLPLVALNFCFHSTAVTSEGALLATRDLGFLCARRRPRAWGLISSTSVEAWRTSRAGKWYAGLGAAVLGLHRLIAAKQGGLVGIWSVYLLVQLSRALVFPVRAGMVRRPAWTRLRSRRRTPALALA